MEIVNKINVLGTTYMSKYLELHNSVVIVELNYLSGDTTIFMNWDCFITIGITTIRNKNSYTAIVT